MALEIVKEADQSSWRRCTSKYRPEREAVADADQTLDAQVAAARPSQKHQGPPKRAGDGL
jgi:hypothetical protein